MANVNIHQSGAVNCMIILSHYKIRVRCVLDPLVDEGNYTRRVKYMYKQEEKLAFSSFQVANINRGQTEMSIIFRLLCILKFIKNYNSV